MKEAIGRRLSRLSEETISTLRLASVIGHEFDLTFLLRKIGDRSVEMILDAIDEARVASLVTGFASQVDGFAFTHVLVRRTLYDELNPVRRALEYMNASVPHSKSLPPGSLSSASTNWRITGWRRQRMSITRRRQ